MTDAAGYGAADLARWSAEPAKRTTRTAFQRDHARVIHSSALRRLSAKTQVMGPDSDDFVRNRLTHTLEVAQIGRELALTIGCDADVVVTACLSHDLGHPPFGHNGERALNDAAAGIGGFEGNAQTLRILTRLEAKSFHATGALRGRSAGLNLTRASLDASVKYPWPLADAPHPVGAHADGSPRQVRKFGVYDDDAAVFDWLRRGAPPGRLCLEAQVMDLADDIAYSVHDVEDAVAAGRLDLTRLRDDNERKAVFEAVADWYVPEATTDALDAALDRLASSPDWPREVHTGSRADLARLKNLTSDLIGRFCRAVERVTRERSGAGPLTRYAAALEVPVEVREEIAVLKGIAAHYVMRRQERVRLLERQRRMLTELVSALQQRPALLEPPFRDDYASAEDGSARLRVIVDCVASLTDASAVAWYRTCCGRD